MNHFEVTYGIKDTAGNVKRFMRENMDTFWTVFKPLMPYIVALTVLDVLITVFLIEPDAETGEKVNSGIGGLIASYFLSCLIITWHRVVIHGGERYEPMNPLRPRKSELAFIGMGILFMIVPFLAGFIFGLAGIVIGAAIFPVLAIVLIALVYVGLRLMFYFPAKATGNHISLMQSFAMTKGYIWKMLASSFLAAIKLWLLAVLYVIAGVFLVGTIMFASGGNAILSIVLGVAFALPLVLFFQPLLAVIWVTVLSNYYQHAVQFTASPEPPALNGDA